MNRRWLPTLDEFQASMMGAVAMAIVLDEFSMAIGAGVVWVVLVVCSGLLASIRDADDR